MATRVVAPAATVAGTEALEYPLLETCKVYEPGARLPIANAPKASVVPPAAVGPASETLAPSSGAPDALSTTVPPTWPVDAIDRTSAAAPSARSASAVRYGSPLCGSALWGSRPQLPFSACAAVSAPITPGRPAVSLDADNSASSAAAFFSVSPYCPCCCCESSQARAEAIDAATGSVAA